MSQGIHVADDSVKRESTDRFACPSCGGNMSFDADTQTLACPYCDNKIVIAGKEGDINEYDLESAVDEQAGDWGCEKRVIRCEGCGAQTVLDTAGVAQFCSFCGSSHIVKDEKSAGIAPESIIPFKISAKKAVECFSAWIKKRYFAPNALKTEHQTQRLTGVYIPCWTYDSDTYSTYTGEGGTYYYETVTDWVEENGKRKAVTRRVRKIRWWPASGTYSQYFDDVLINASKKIDETLMNKLEPFDLGDLVQYKPEYLSGFLAERYTIGVKEGWEKAKDNIKGVIRNGVIEKINADEVRNLRINTSYQNVKYKHILIPVWISAYKYRNKLYQYMVNAQTGEVQGRAPVSPWKVAVAVIAALIVAGGGVFLWNYLK